MAGDTTRSTIERVWKDEGPSVIGCLVRLVRDVSRAEELAHDALVAALEEWPRTGIPDRPGAWLVTTARNRAFNALRRDTVASRVAEELARTGAKPATDMSIVDNPIPDDALRLIFMACHPILSTDARVALTLRLIAGLTTEEIARAFLSTEPAIAQRIVRAKRMLADANLPFELPPAGELGARLASVLDVVYLLFNEGHTATSGDDVMRPALVTEALRIGALLATLAPLEPEVHGLVALMNLHASRSATRVDAEGEPVLLKDQDRTRWDAAQISTGLAALAAADELASTAGKFHLQASIAACHATAPSIDTTDWARIAALYAELAKLTPSPVIELNRAMAISRAQSPAAGLALVDKLQRDGALATYHFLPAARAELFEQLGRYDKARAEFEHAASLTSNARQRARLLARAAACAEADRITR